MVRIFIEHDATNVVVVNDFSTFDDYLRAYVVQSHGLQSLYGYRRYRTNVFFLYIRQRFAFPCHFPVVDTPTQSNRASAVFKTFSKYTLHTCAYTNTVRARRFVVVLLFFVHDQFFYIFPGKLKTTTRPSTYESRFVYTR